ncbi:LppU family putative lipoprotein [Rhodococcus spongiicola]|uniref:LppU family putative lipoprotein n=1 Tax=Rhodococcus spongiicola TaxID=2487352 RepID=UPI001F350796|nr:hypothetical protein [Rhodococcus spongiicola]
MRRSVGAGAVAAATMLAAACGGSAEGTATAADAASESSSPSTSESAIAGQEGSDRGGRVDLDVEIGDCVRLGGTMDSATIAEAVCASEGSNYKVVAKAKDSEQCPSDVDQIYSESMFGSDVGVLCLDVDWVEGGCMSLPATNDDDPQRVDCDDPNASSVERVTEIIEGVSDPTVCPEGGFVYDERLFTVCAETVRA